VEYFLNFGGRSQNPSTKNEEKNLNWEKAIKNLGTFIFYVECFFLSL